MYRAFSTSKHNMPPIFDKPTTEKYDYVVIGGGSGGSGTSVSDNCFSLKIFYIRLCLIIEESCFLRQESCCGRGRSIPWRNLRQCRCVTTFKFS